MINRNLETQPNGQEKLWAHYQNNAPEVFMGAKPRLDFLIRQISRLASGPNPCVLNIGVGNGYFEETARQHGWKVYSLDPDERAIEVLKAKGYEAHTGSIEEMPFSNGIFDFVVASEVLEHLTDEQRSRGLREVIRVLRRYGWFIGTVPFCEDLLASQVFCPKCGEVFHRWGHQKSFSIPIIKGELSDSFETVKVKRTTFVTSKGQPFLGKIQTLVVLMMAKYGAMVSMSSIYFRAMKGDRESLE